MKDVVQNNDASKFAVTYFDDGLFKIRTFEKPKDACMLHTEEEFDSDDEVDQNFNDLLDIDKSTEAIDNFPHPMCFCCFITDDIIFVFLFHN